MTRWWVILESTPGALPCDDEALGRLNEAVSHTGHVALAPTGELYGRLHLHAIDAAAAETVGRRMWSRFLMQAGIKVRGIDNVDVLPSTPPDA